jgi:hypothetical protein
MTGAGAGLLLTPSILQSQDAPMPSISFETLKGYVLEEILARLIRNTGYRLLVDESQDAQELRNLPNGL